MYDRSEYRSWLWKDLTEGMPNAGPLPDKEKITTYALERFYEILRAASPREEYLHSLGIASRTLYLIVGSSLDVVVAHLVAELGEWDRSELLAKVRKDWGEGYTVIEWIGSDYVEASKELLEKLFLE